ncbi:MAG: MATE family efflux transporter, partial [Anaerolineaceae bacterium]|nr:MATE family efflux transporter [Anaerolineaceae bacterium]
GLSYLYVTMGGLFALILVFIINSMLRGAGEARFAMMVLFLTTAVTLLLQPVLIFGWGPFPQLGVAGSAWATVLGYGSGFILQIVVLLRGRARIRIDLHNLKPDFPLMGRIIRIALPSTIQMVIRSSSRLIIVGLVGVYGTFAIAAYGVANRILMIIIIPAFGLANAAGALVGQNLGALKPERAERIVWWISAYTSVYMLISVALTFAFAQPLMTFFDPTSQVVAMGVECIKIIAPTLLISAIGIVLGRGFTGSGDTVPPMTVNFFTLWGMELPFAYGLSKWLGLGIIGIWWGRAIANAANGILFIIWFRLGNWKRRKV